MNRSRFPRFTLFLLFVFALMVPLCFIIMYLWNTILVAVLHVSVIDFWQALGIFAMSRILFGGFPDRLGRAGYRRRWHEMDDMKSKWFNLSPEERKHFKEDWKNRFGGGQTTVPPDLSGKE
jgi:hypothetical protein